MTYLRTLAAAALASLPVQVRAFDRCDAILASPAELEGFLYGRGVYDAPVQVFDAARSIRIETGDTANGLIPHAGRTAEGQPVIYYPVAFSPVLCRIVLASYVVIDAHEETFAEVSRDAGLCAESGTPFDDCLVQYSRDLETRYGADFAALDKQNQETAYRMLRYTAAQIGVHEFAHLLLEHPTRIAEGSLARINAEFEADFYAILNGVQIGEAPSAMNYFFLALADMESYSDALQSQGYESAYCRLTNVGAIVTTFGIGPAVVLDAAAGGFAANTSPELLRETANELRREIPPVPAQASCRLSGRGLHEAHGELAKLAAVVAEHAELLLGRRQDSYNELGLATPEAVEMLDQLRSESRNFVHLRVLAAQVVSRLIQRIGWGLEDTAMAENLDLALQTAAEDMLARDYARLLNVAGLIAFEDRSRSLEARLSDARQILESAVKYSPDLSESWLALAFIAAAEERCDDAAALFENAARLVTDEPERVAAEEKRDRMRTAVAGGTCPKEAETWRTIFAK